MDNIIQVSKLLEKLKITDIDNGRKIFEFLINLLVYMPVGSTVSTNLADIHKVDNEFIKLDIKIDNAEIIDFLEKSKIIKII